MLKYIIKNYLQLLFLQLESGGGAEDKAKIDLTDGVSQEESELLDAAKSYYPQEAAILEESTKNFLDEFKLEIEDGIESSLKSGFQIYDDKGLSALNSSLVVLGLPELTHQQKNEIRSSYENGIEVTVCLKNQNLEIKKVLLKGGSVENVDTASVPTPEKIIPEAYEAIEEKENLAISKAGEEKTPELIDKKIIDNTRYYFNQNITEDNKELVLGALMMEDGDMNNTEYVKLLHFRTKAFQTNTEGLNPDGYPGEATFAKIHELYAPAEMSLKTPDSSPMLDDRLNQDEPKADILMSESGDENQVKSKAPETIPAGIPDAELLEDDSQSLELSQNTPMTKKEDVEAFESQMNAKGEDFLTYSERGKYIDGQYYVGEIKIGIEGNKIVAELNGQKEGLKFDHLGYQEVFDPVFDLMLSKFKQEEIQAGSGEESISVVTEGEKVSNLKLDALIIDGYENWHPITDRARNFYDADYFTTFFNENNAPMISSVLGFEGEIDPENPTHIAYLYSLVVDFQREGADGMLGPKTLAKIIDAYTLGDREKHDYIQYEYSQKLNLDFDAAWGQEKVSERGESFVNWEFTDINTLKKVATMSYDGPVHNREGKQVIFSLLGSSDHKKISRPEQDSSFEKTHFAFHQTATTHEANNADISEIQYGFDEHMSAYGILRNGNIIEYHNPEIGKGGLGKKELLERYKGLNEATISVEMVVLDGPMREGISGDGYYDIAHINQNQLIAGRFLKMSFPDLELLDSLDPAILEDGSIFKDAHSDHSSDAEMNYFSGEMNTSNYDRSKRVEKLVGKKVPMDAFENGLVFASSTDPAKAPTETDKTDTGEKEHTVSWITEAAQGSSSSPSDAIVSSPISEQDQASYSDENLLNDDTDREYPEQEKLDTFGSITPYNFPNGIENGPTFIETQITAVQKIKDLPKEIRIDVMTYLGIASLANHKDVCDRAYNWQYDIMGRNAADGILGNVSCKVLFHDIGIMKNPDVQDALVYASESAEKIAKEVQTGVENEANCGAEMRRILGKHCGITDVPTSGMDGKNYAQYLESSPNYVSVPITNPLQSKPCGILVYQEGCGPKTIIDENGETVDAPRYYAGHVETRLPNGQFYFGHKENNSPGGSVPANWNPMKVGPEGAGFIGKVYYPKPKNMRPLV